MDGEDYHYDTHKEGDVIMYSELRKELK
jgi:hypothetical protein